MIRLFVLAAALAFPSLALSQAAPLSPALVDPPRDDANPARNEQLLIPSAGFEMNALFFLAQGAGPKPTMALLHGLPGNERNLDLAQAVRRAGWNVLTFTYRGTWGSQGKFSVTHSIEDAAAALAFIRRPEVAAKYRVDPRRIVIAGHSMGGLAAALTAAGDKALAGLALFDAWDPGADAEWFKTTPDARAQLLAGMNDFGHSLGATTVEDVADEIIAKAAGRSLAPHVRALAARPVLTIYATHGGAEANGKLAERMRQAPGARVTAIQLDSDHGFADSRIRLATETMKWLTALPAR